MDPVVSLMSCKGLDKNGDGFVSDEIKCIDYACEHGAKVLNCSWGGGPSQLLYNALSRAQRAGVICVAAAGNDGTDESSTGNKRRYDRVSQAARASLLFQLLAPWQVLYPRSAC